MFLDDISALLNHGMISPNLERIFNRFNQKLIPYLCNADISSYRIDTKYVINKNKRVTLAVRGVRRLDTSVVIITYLLAELDSLKINVKKLYLNINILLIQLLMFFLLLTNIGLIFD
ncbi:MAG: hypothetical protein V7K57_07720, partial [Nostoc sp.]